MNLGPMGFVNAAADMVRESFSRLATANSGKFVVNHDNVLAAAKIIQNQVEALETKLEPAALDLVVVPPGGDTVSGLVAQEWNKRLIDNEDSYAMRVSDYVAGLKNLVTQLGDSASAYGYNEEEVAAALGTTSA